MKHYIVKHILVCLSLALTCNICFGQFKDVNPREGGIKGKADSVVFMNFNIKKTDTGEVKEFNDKCVYIYNSKGLIIEERRSAEYNDPWPFKTVYHYNDKGNRSEVFNYKRKGVLSGKGTYTFDPAKRLVEVRNGHYLTTKLLLDNAGNILEETNYQLHYPIPFSITRYKYDRKGLCIESVQSWSKSTDVQKIVYAYDDDHNLIKETIINNLKPLAIYTYGYLKYDKKHNWLVQNTYQDGSLTGVTERNITYK